MNRRFGGRSKTQRLLGPDGPKTALELCLLQRELFSPSTVAALSGSKTTGASLGAAFNLGDSDGSLKAWAAAERAIYMESTLIPDADAFSMSHSVELRVPFVDHVLRAFTLGIPERVGRARGKARFVNTIADETLHAVARRPKTGFTVPMPRLMQSDPLRAYVADALKPNAPIWDVLHRDTGAPILSNSTTSRWSEAWALVALNSWLGSFQHSEVRA